MPKKRNPDYRVVGKRLETLRKAHGYETIRSVADALGVHEDTWRAWEVGDNLVPVSIAKRLKNRWGVTLDYLYDGQETAMPPALMDKLRAA